MRVQTGIDGLDGLIAGGFNENDVCLVTGGTGTGKTIFCCQFLYEGLKNGENGLFFSLEEMPEDIVNDAKEFGWDFTKYINEKKFFIEYQDPFEMSDLISQVKDKIMKMNAKRVVIDSTSVFGLVFKTSHDLRKKLFEFARMLKSTGCVAILTAEIPESSQALSRFGVEEFVADGVIILRPSLAKTGRTLEIRKMRRTKHDENIHGIEIGKDGIRLRN